MAKADRLHLGNSPRSQSGALYYILSGRTQRGCDHSVLCLGGRIVKNPSLDPDNDLVAPAADGKFETTYIVPLRQPFMSEDDFIEVAKSWRRDEILSLVAA